MRKAVLLLAAAVAIAMAAPASAVTLLNVTNAPSSSAVPQTLTFTATSTSTLLNFEGYNLPSSTVLVNLFLGTTGSTPSTANNLLGLHYTYTPSTCASPFHAFEGSVGSYGANDLVFEGACTGLYDSLAQTVATTVGTSYTLRFALSTFGNGSNGLRITATDANVVAPVPEPATWAMMLLGFGGMGLAMRRRTRREGAKSDYAQCS